MDLKGSCIPLASLHIEVNGGSGGGEGCVAQAQDGAVKVALATSPKAVCCLRKLHLLAHA